MYAIEATDIAAHAQQVVDANGVGDRVTIINARLEDVTLDGLPNGGKHQVGAIPLLVSPSSSPSSSLEPNCNFSVHKPSANDTPNPNR